MTRHLVLGAGPTGGTVASLLADEGHDVVLVSRSGKGPAHPRIRARALDAADGAALTRAAEGVVTVFNCAMPRYDRWPEEFPPIGRAAVAAARAAGAALVTLSNTYGYGAVSGPFSEALPMAPTSVKGVVRAAMWQDALASGIRATEVRASDFLGRGALSVYTLMVLPSVLGGGTAHIPADLDAPRSWSFTGDVARALVAAAKSDSSWGRAWHVPSNVASIRAVTERLAELAGRARPALVRMQRADLLALAAADSIMREVVEVAYLLENAILLDARDTEARLGVAATPLDAVLRDTLAIERRPAPTSSPRRSCRRGTDGPS